MLGYSSLEKCDSNILLDSTTSPPISKRWHTASVDPSDPNLLISSWNRYCTAQLQLASLNGPPDIFSVLSKDHLRCQSLCASAGKAPQHIKVLEMEAALLAVRHMG